MLSKEDIQLIKATLPVVASNAETITKTFYGHLFTRNPEMLAYFNQSHQKIGLQPRALAHSIIAYASNIENLQACDKMLKLIAEKHISYNVYPEQYAIIGENLMLAIGEVLGSAVTVEIARAWENAYKQLAQVFIDMEAELMEKYAAMKGGWKGKRTFQVVKKEKECEHLYSFYLKPTDNGDIITHKPGQYVAVSVNLLQENNYPVAPRNYTLSNVPGEGHYRITVRDMGIVSGYLHSQTEVGSTVELSVPCGAFTLDYEALPTRPSVFLGAGSGITPVLPMFMEATKVPESKTTFIYSCKNGAHHPFRSDVERFVSKEQKGTVHFAFTQPVQGEDDQCHSKGRLTPKDIISMLGTTEFDCYMCGPTEFLSTMIRGLEECGVPRKYIHAESFGPQA